MKLKSVSILIAFLAVAAGSELLVRVELARGADERAVADAGATVLRRFDGWCLATVADDQLGDVPGTTLLDDDPSLKRYVYALDGPGFDRSRLAACGTTLTEDREGVLLRVTEEGIKQLNRLPVELCGVSMHPLVPSSPAPGHRFPDPAAVSDSLIWTLMARASQDSAEAVLRRLIAFHTRYAYTDSSRSAALWFQSRLVAYGCDTTYLDTFQSSLAPSVIGVKRGRVNPNLIHIVCGHVDNTSEIPYDFAPGSDDNASGAGLVLEAARMFAGIDFDCTVWFVGFGGEEQGLVGSDSFARHCRERGDSIILAINHDMDSYGTAGRDSIRVVGKRSNPPCSTWVVYYMAMADTFTDLKCHMEIVDQQSSSDQASFWQYGYTAIRDRYLDRDPVYHTTGDTIGPFEYAQCGTNNIPMYTEAIKATVATIAKLAGARAESTAVTESRPIPVPVTIQVAPTVGRAPVHVRLRGMARGISVYDAAGNLVRVLAQSQFDDRQSSMTWDGRTSAGNTARAGIYYFRVAGAGPAARFVLAR
jgi:hypothetical protein